MNLILEKVSQLQNLANVSKLKNDNLNTSDPEIIDPHSESK